MRRAALASAVLLVVGTVACSDGDDAADDTEVSPATAATATTASTTTATGPSTTAADTGPRGPACERITVGAEALATMTTGQALGDIGDASTFATTVSSMGMTAELDDGGPFTVLVPTDDAFAALGADAPPADELVAGHVVDGSALDLATLVADGGAEGRLGPISAVETPDGALVDRGGGPGTVVCRDIATANGMIHLLDAVLLPAPDDTAAVGGTQLYTVDLTTGAATSAGGFGGEAGVLGMTAALDGGRMFAVTDALTLLNFDAADPSAAQSLPITGVEGETLLTLEMTPDGRLLAISDAGTLYEIDAASAAATALPGRLDPPLDDPGLGFDVAPDGQGRVLVASGLNEAVDVTTGATTALDAAPTFDAEDANGAVTPRTVAAASAPEGDSLYVVDASSGVLAMTTSPGDGVLLTVGPLGVPLTDGASLDIDADGIAYLSVPG